MKTKSLLITLFFAFLLLAFSVLAANAQIEVPTNTGLPEPTDRTGGAGPVMDVVFYFVGWILSLFMLLAVLGFVITGIQFLMAFGDYQRVETAKKNFTYSVIAVAVVGGALVIIRTIDWILS
jgi:uncharacterized membrane protein